MCCKIFAFNSAWFNNIPTSKSKCLLLKSIWDTAYSPSFFSELAKICKLIEEIFIDLKGDNIALADLIKTQKQIKFVKLHIQSNQEEYKDIAKENMLAQ